MQATHRLTGTHAAINRLTERLQAHGFAAEAILGASLLSRLRTDADARWIDRIAERVSGGELGTVARLGTPE